MALAKARNRLVWLVIGLLVIAVPNAIFMAAFLFAVAVLVRSEIVSFIAGLGLLTVYGVTEALTQNIEHERIGYPELPDEIDKAFDLRFEAAVVQVEPMQQLLNRCLTIYDREMCLEDCSVNGLIDDQALALEKDCDTTIFWIWMAPNLLSCEASCLDET